MLRAVDFQVPACTAAQNSHCQNQQKRPGITFLLGLGFRLLRRFRHRSGFGSCASTLGHVDRADLAIRMDGSGRTFFCAGAGRKFSASGLQCCQQIGFIHHVQKVGVILFAVLVHRLVIVNDNVKGVAAAGFHRDELFVGCSIVEQIAGHKVSILRKALARGNGRRWLRGRSFFHNRRFLIPAVRIGIGRDCKAA